jgi:hypothetical protein
MKFRTVYPDFTEWMCYRKCVCVKKFYNTNPVFPSLNFLFFILVFKNLFQVSRSEKFCNTGVHCSCIFFLSNIPFLYQFPSNLGV